MDEQKIREAAHRLWEKEGKPQGKDLEHWFTAENSTGEEDSDSSTAGSKLGSENAPSQADSTAETDNQNDGR
ncbi:DUF2934 domain-containing protein [Pseudomonas sp. PLMAX]|uniref:DUF2934 domain-containing protein n=1 Tax=Pseudomonas sp. PLMAX TaxID=2201998 RepID=UPI0038BB766A